MDVVHDGSRGCTARARGRATWSSSTSCCPAWETAASVRRPRAASIDVPILMLTAKDGEYDEAGAGLTGADDYLTKPFLVRGASSRA